MLWALVAVLEAMFYQDHIHVNFISPLQLTTFATRARDLLHCSHEPGNIG